MASRHVPMVAKRCSAKDPVEDGGELFPTERKAKEAPADGSRPKGWVDIHEVAAKLGESDPFGARKSAAIDKMLQEAKLPATATAVVSATEVDKPSSMAGNNGKYRLSKSFIKGIISLRREPLPTTEYMDSLAPLFPPEWLEEQKRLHEEEVEICRKVEDDFEEFRLRVIQEVKEKGYFEVDEKFVANLKAADEHMTQHWATKDFSGLRFATPEEEALNADGYHQYVPDEDDALLSDGDDDDELCSSG